MKRMMMLSSILLVFIFATACSNGVSEPNTTNDTTNVENKTDNNNGVVNNNSDVANNQSETDTGNTSSSGSDKDKAENQDDMKEMLNALDFYEFDLDVDYGDDKDFDIEIDHHSNGDIEAEVEDDLNNKHINDDLEAFNYIYPNVKKLNVSKDIDKQDAIDQVLKAFDLPEDYREIEIEFEFEDGTKVKFEEEK